MANRNPLYLHLSHLFRYPDEAYRQHLEEVDEAFANEELRESLEPLKSFVAQNDFTALEELFTRTFDMNPLTCLEVGWHLYGEDYKRGEFLVKMRQALAQYSLPESVELPDHMSHCLTLMAFMELEDAPVLAEGYLLPVIKKILKGFKPENPFHGLLVCLEILLVDLIGPGSGYIGQEARSGQGVSELVSLTVD